MISKNRFLSFKQKIVNWKKIYYSTYLFLEGILIHELPKNSSKFLGGIFLNGMYRQNN